MKKMHKKIYKATQMLIELLSEKEVPSSEISRISKAIGISGRTLARAKLIVKVKREKKEGGLLLTIPKEEVEAARESSEKLNPQIPIVRRSEICEAYIERTEWVSVENEANELDSRPVPKMRAGTLRIKVGKYEIEADTEYPIEKVIELLRVLEAATNEV